MPDPRDDNFDEREEPSPEHEALADDAEPIDSPQRVDRFEQASWQAPRGPLTKAVAWIILAVMALFVIVGLVAMVMSVV